MSTTYNDLKASIQSYGKRTDAATISAIPQFIQSAQAKLDTVLRIPAMLATKDYTAVDTVPMELMKIDSVLINGVVGLMMPLETVLLRRASNCPDHMTPIYAVSGSNILLVVPSDVSVTGYQQPPRLSDSVQTNAYTKGAENAILWQSLIYLAVFARDSKAAQSWASMANDEVTALNTAADEYESASGVLSVPRKRYF